MGTILKLKCPPLSHKVKFIATVKVNMRTLLLSQLQQQSSFTSVVTPEFDDSRKSKVILCLRVTCVVVDPPYEQNIGWTTVNKLYALSGIVQRSVAYLKTCIKNTSLLLQN